MEIKNILNSSHNDHINKSKNEMVIKNEEINNKSKKKCAFKNCYRKINILWFECKCKLIFCKNHNVPELHNCVFDYKNDFKKKLKHDLIKITCDKIKWD